MFVILLVVVAILLAVNIIQMCIWLKESDPIPRPAELHTANIEKKIEVRYFNNKLSRISKLSNGDWYDLRSAMEMEVKAGNYYMIPLGVSMKLPDGYEALVVPRSSTFRRWGLIQTNSVGVIDNSYCGNKDQWHMPVYATRDEVIHFNDRVCQFRIIKNQPKLNFTEVEALLDNNRGGFGSTGVN